MADIDTDLGKFSEAIQKANREQAKAIADNLDKLIENHARQIELAKDLQKAAKARMDRIALMRREIKGRHGV